MFLDTATGTNKAIHTVPGDNLDANIDSGYEKNFYNELSDCDKKNLCKPIAPALSDESAIPMIADDHIPKKQTHHLVEVIFFP